MASSPVWNWKITWYRDKTFFDDFEVVNLIDVALEFFDKICVELEGEFAFDIMMEDELEERLW